MGDEPQSRTRSASVKSNDLKKQVYELISKDKSLLELIAEAVSTCIVERITEDENFVNRVSTKLTSQTDFKTSLADQISEDITQRVYESLAYDVVSANEKIDELKSSQSEAASA